MFDAWDNAVLLAVGDMLFERCKEEHACDAWDIEGAKLLKDMISMSTTFHWPAGTVSTVDFVEVLLEASTALDVLERAVAIRNTEAPLSQSDHVFLQTTVGLFSMSERWAAIVARGGCAQKYIQNMEASFRGAYFPLDLRRRSFDVLVRDLNVKDEVVLFKASIPADFLGLRVPEEFPDLATKHVIGNAGKVACRDSLV